MSNRWSTSSQTASPFISANRRPERVCRVLDNTTGSSILIRSGLSGITSGSTSIQPFHPFRTFCRLGPSLPVLPVPAAAEKFETLDGAGDGDEKAPVTRPSGEGDELSIVVPAVVSSGMAIERLGKGGDIMVSGLLVAEWVDVGGCVGADARAFLTGRASPPESLAAGRFPLFALSCALEDAFGVGGRVGEHT